MPLSGKSSSLVLLAVSFALFLFVAPPAKASVVYNFNGMDASFDCGVVGCPSPSGFVGSFQLTFPDFVHNSTFDCSPLLTNTATSDYCTFQFEEGAPFPTIVGTPLYDTGITVVVSTTSDSIDIAMLDSGGDAFSVFFPVSPDTAGSYNNGVEFGTLDIEGTPSLHPFGLFQPGIDALDTPTPEPSETLPLALGLALAAFAGFLLRRRNRAFIKSTAPSAKR